MKQKVLVSGYVSMDHIINIATPAQTGYTSLITNADNSKIYYGGCSVNIAVSLSCLGVPAMPLLRVGRDYESNGFLNFLKKAGVLQEGIEVLEEETTSTCYLIQDNHNNHMTIYYPGSMDKKYAKPIPDSYFENTSLGVITVASKPDNSYFLEQCIKHNIPVVFGMKDDFDAFPVEFLKKLLVESTIIFMNEIERELIENLFGCSSIRKLFELGKASVIVTTKGEGGSLCYYRNETGEIEKYVLGVCSVKEVVDTTGAGDAYMAGFLYGYLNKRSVKESCCLGSALASFILQGIGCCTNIPDSTALEAKAKELYERKV